MFGACSLGGLLVESVHFFLLSGAVALNRALNPKP